MRVPGAYPRIPYVDLHRIPGCSVPPALAAVLLTRHADAAPDAPQIHDLGHLLLPLLPLLLTYWRGPCCIRFAALFLHAVMLRIRWKALSTG